MTTSRRPLFRGCRYSVMFRPPSLLAPRIVPTAASTAAGQLGLLRLGLSCFVASARSRYANRPKTGNWRYGASDPLHPSLRPPSIETECHCWVRLWEVRSCILSSKGSPMDRRTFNTALMSAAATSLVGSRSMAAAGRTVWYQGVGNRLTQWDVDVDAATLTPRASVTLPSNIQYVWPHPSRKYLYVSTSDAASGNAPNPGTVHRLCAFRVDESGALSLHGDPAVLPQRPIHNSVDARGDFALTCYNNPSNLTVHRINSDATVGAYVPQEAKLDFGIFAHQILAMPGNRAVIMVTRGNR